MKFRNSTTEGAKGNDPLTGRILAAAVSVHRELGPGFLECVYEEALNLEMVQSGLFVERQKVVPVYFREHHVGEHRLDFLVERKVIVELKALTTFLPIHIATVRSYLNATGFETGLLLNFASTTLEIKRIGRRFTPEAPVDLLT